VSDVQPQPSAARQDPSEGALSSLAVEGLRVEERGPVVEVTIDRPERRNALTPDVISALMELLAVARDDRRLRAVLLTGAGERAFCAGFDIEMIESVGGADTGAERDLVDQLATTVRELPVPVVAAVNGAAVGAGCDLAVACDIRVGGPAARFGMPPARLGILYGWKGVERLIDTVGPAAAKELLLTGELVDAQRAHHIGLLSAVVATDQLLAEARRITDVLAANAPLSVAGSKRMVGLLARPGELSEADHAALAEIQHEVWNSEDAVEGARAYRERRPPEFRGR
jgi:enoyl-CoA hydratase/carnithine racemase